MKVAATEPSEEEIQTYLEEVYYDIGRPGSYESVGRVWESIKEEGNPLHLTRQQVNAWLMKQSVYARHLHVNHRFPRQKILMN